MRLRIGTRQWTVPLTVEPDPRVQTSAAAYGAQFETARRLATAVDASTEAMEEAESLRVQIKDLLASPQTPEAPLRALDAHLSRVLKPGDEDKTTHGLKQLNSQAASLYGQ